jgi:hypothetical protein
MAALIWQPTRDALASAVARANAHSNAAIGNELLASLDGLGPIYDARFTPAVAASKAEAERANSAALGAWLRPRFGDIDAAARWAEAQQVAANTGRVTNPYLQSVVSASVVLAPSIALPIVETVSAARVAAVKIGDMVITARDPGYLGNSITVTIADTSAEPAERLFRVVVALGAYQETEDPRMPGGPIGLLSSLVAQGAWTVDPARPTNGAYVLAGGAGDCVAELLGRIQRAAALPAIRADEASRAVVGSFVDQATEMSRRRPKPKFSEPYASVRNQETSLAGLLERAARWLAIIA